MCIFALRKQKIPPVVTGRCRHHCTLLSQPALPPLGTERAQSTITSQIAYKMVGNLVIVLLSP